MNVRLIIIQFVLIACTSCSSDKTLIKGCGIPIVLNEIKTSLVDTAFFQASSIIPLESNDNFSLIRSIDRICVIDDTFYMLDRSLGKVFMYSTSGKYLGQINDIGSGPGEYIQISDITVDQKRKNIVLLCDRSYKVMYYTNAGKLMKEVSYSDYYSEFIVNGDSIYCYKVGLKDVDYILTYTYPMDFLRKEALHERPYFDSGSSGNFTSFDVGNRLTISDAVYFTRPLESCIYSIDRNGIYEKYAIDFKEHHLPKSLLEKNMSAEDFLNICDENKYVCSITNVVGNRDYLLFKTNIGLFIYDKQLKRLEGYYFILNSPLRGGSPNYLPVNNASQIIQIMQPMQFKQYMDIQKERNKTDDKLNPVYENIYQNLHDEDNPILIIYELPYKNNIIEE